jgi:hypothetical protein
MRGGDVDTAMASGPVIEMVGDGQALVNGVLMLLPATDGVIDVEAEGGPALYKLNSTLTSLAGVQYGSVNPGDPKEYANGVQIDVEGFLRGGDPEEAFEAHMANVPSVQQGDETVFIDGAVFTSTMASQPVITCGGQVGVGCVNGVVVFE